MRDKGKRKREDKLQRMNQGDRQRKKEGVGVRKYYEVRRKVETGICNDPWLFNILFDSG